MRNFASHTLLRVLVVSPFASQDDPTIAKLDVCILGLFTIECMMKIVSDPLRPWTFFTGENASWNNFDFLIVLACMPFMPFGSAAAAMRLLRLLRVLKLLSSNPQLRMILVGLGAGLQSAVWIFFLMFLIFYMFAVFGIMMFAEEDQWHFGGYERTFYTLWRLSTFDGWTDVLYLHYYGDPSSVS